MLANRMMMGAAGSFSGPYMSNGSLLDIECVSGADPGLDGWADEDFGTGESTAVTNEPVADSVPTAWKMDSGADTGVERAVRTKDIGSIESLGNTVIVSLKLYCDLIGTHSNGDYQYIGINRSDCRTMIEFASDGLWYYTGAEYLNAGDCVVEDTWQEWTFVVHYGSGVANATMDVYIDDVLTYSGLDVSYTRVDTDGKIALIQYGNTTANQLTYIDYIKIGDGWE